MFNAEKIPVVGSLFDSGEERAARQQFQNTANRYRQLKPEVGASYENALRQQLMAYGPANDYIGGMLGPGYKLDLNAMSQSPATPGMMAPGRNKRPGLPQRGADFISSFDPAAGNALSGAFGGLFGLF